MKETKSKRSFKELYALCKRIPGYTPGEAARKLIQGLIWSHTKERAYRKSELTEKELNSLCQWIRESYPPTATRRKLTPSVDEHDHWRKRVIAVIIENCELKGAGSRFEQNKVAYAKAVAERACNRELFGKLTEAQLTAVYNRFLRENEIIKNHIE